MDITLWIQTHWDDILTIVGALYLAGRTTVYLTPTPDDDLYFVKASGFIKTIALLLGLNIKQGVNTKS